MKVVSSELLLEHLEPDARKRINSLIHRTEVGNDQILTTPLGGTDPELLKADFSNTFVGDFEASDFNLPLREYEMAELSKFGPRSRSLPWDERKETVEVYFGPFKTSTTFTLPNVAFGLQPMSFSAAMGELVRSSSASLPSMKRKSVVIDSGYDSLAWERDLDRAKDLPSGYWPCLLYTRTQEDYKTRAVWGFAMCNTILEYLYSRPLHEVQSKLPWRSALRGPDDVDLGVTSVFDRARRANTPIISIDFSAYDSSISPSLTKSAFDYIAGMFRSSFRASVDDLREMFTNVPIVTPSGIFTGEHGVPSGSAFTNEVDSIVQYGLLLQAGVDIAQVQGDDGLTTFSDLSHLYGVFDSAGVKLNDQKTVVSDAYCIYLRNLYHTDFQHRSVLRGVYPISRALNRLVYLERFVDLHSEDLSGDDYFNIRAVSILENCKWHPLFEKFVKWVASKDAHKLNFMRSAVAKVSRLADAEESAGVLHRYGSNLRGIESFRTIQVLRGL